MPPSRSLRQPSVHQPPSRDLRSDDELVQHAQTDPQAFATLYLRYIDSIHAYCFWRLGDREAAEDATSQVFTQALAGLARFDDQRGSFRSWLYTIAHHVVVDHYRKPPRSGPLDGAAEIAATDRSPEDHVIATEQERSLHAALDALTARERQVMELRLAGLTGAEIGTVLGCRAGAVGIAQFRAVRKLRVLLAVDDTQLERPDHV